MHRLSEKDGKWHSTTAADAERPTAYCKERRTSNVQYQYEGIGRNESVIFLVHWKIHLVFFARIHEI